MCRFSRSTGTAQARCSNPAAVEHGARTSINQRASCDHIGVCEWKLSFRNGQSLEVHPSVGVSLGFLTQTLGKHSWPGQPSAIVLVRGFGNEFLIPSPGPASGTLSSLTDTFELNSPSIQEQLRWVLLGFSQRTDQTKKEPDPSLSPFSRL